ncbi:hypothetical protein [Sinomonas sp. ASV322]|uniref:hypothetical protein n=1 Tax=Sinomonas sp. ASV322 TaxID=3041920 RepID=UPI0027DB742B|nr:hypothetical protein [Sinomonas sp. ASV322]MDQ4504393.1 hypothetical protein [Sinomonas sp. ASV322]
MVISFGRRHIFAALSGILGSLALAISFNPSVAAFTASIANSNSAGSGTVSLQETSGATVCNSTDGGSISTNSATCTTINKYGGNLAMVPGQAVTTTVTFTNAGTSPIQNFTLTPGSCTQSTNGTVNGTAIDLCSKLQLTIASGATTVFSGTATSFAASPAISLAAPLAAGGTQSYTFTVTLDSAAGNTYQGLKASQPMTWSASN